MSLLKHVQVPKYPVILSEIDIDHHAKDDSDDGNSDEEDEDYADLEDRDEVEELNSLNKNHSHFLFVDNPGHKASSVSEIKFRTCFEEYMIKSETGRAIIQFLNLF